jgi:hypothetical protein
MIIYLYTNVVWWDSIGLIRLMWAMYNFKSLVFASSVNKIHFFATSLNKKLFTIIDIGLL